MIHSRLSRTVGLVALLAPLTVSGVANAQDTGGNPSCPSGYSAAFANRTIEGEPIIGENNAPGYANLVKYNELTGLGCYKRSGSTTGTVKFSWAAVGKILGGSIMYVQVYDCGTKKYTGTRTWNFPNGSKVTHNHTTYTFKLKAHHKYKLRVTGGGKYDRSAVANGSSVSGSFFPPSAKPPAWVDKTADCK
jgi:hypothetical protein